MEKIFKILPLALLVSLVFGACVPDDEELVSFNFNASMEGIYDPNASSQGSKVYMRNERWIYWEEDDVISIASNLSDGSKDFFALLAPQSMSANPDFDDFNGIFVTSLPVGSKYFLGLYPFSENNAIVPAGANSSAFNATIHLPEEQPVTSDISFARDVFPMVAWYGGSWDANQPSTPFNLDFHGLASIVRLQFFNTSGVNQVLKQLIFVEQNGKQITGPFSVVDYNTHNPRLVAAGSSSDAMLTMTFDQPRQFRSGNPDDLITVYLVLPSTVGSTGASESFSMSVTLINEEDAGASVNFNVSTKRSAIIYMPAVNVTEFKDELDLNLGLAGHGTVERPYLIYSARDLQYMANQFANPVGGTIYLNNRPVTNDTRFKIMRNDITLEEGYWTRGISGFKGQMTYAANPGASTAIKGIRNTSSVPLFSSIAEGAVVEGIPMYCGIVNTEHAMAFSPFCGENSGTIRDCRILDLPAPAASGISASSAAIFGLCIENLAQGVIERCVSLATFESGGSAVAGICGINNGSILQCNTSSTMSAVVTGPNPHVGGICYENAGIIRDCFFATNIMNSDDNWGAIAYSNTTSGQIVNCYFSHSATLRSSASAGGIVNENSGTIDHCWFEGTLQAGVAGGIAARALDGNIVNSFISISPDVSPAAQVTLGMLNASSTVVGGLVGTLSGGTLRNSYFYANHILTYGSNAICGPLVAKVESGTINNCYVWEEMPSGKAFGQVPASAYSSITNCYLVGGSTSLSYVINISQANAIKQATDPDALVYKLNQTKPSDGMAWVLDALSYPGLEPYTQAP